MEQVRCPVCGRLVQEGSRAIYCRERHRWRGWWARAQDQSDHAQNLPLAALPEGAEEVLPLGGDRLLVAAELVLTGKAPTGAVGYRLGIKHGLSKIMLWFPAIRLFPIGVFLLEPFQRPAVPVSGVYAVVYMDRYLKPLGGPHFTIAVDEVDRNLRYSDGDRTYKPRPRWERFPAH